MPRIRWTTTAADDLESIKTYLDRHYPQFAEPTVRTICQHPASGARRVETDTRFRTSVSASMTDSLVISRAWVASRASGIGWFNYTESASKVMCIGRSKMGYLA